MKVLELRGYKSWQAVQVFQRLMLGLKMLPMYMGEGYPEFYARVEAMPPEDQEKLIREAALLVNMDKEEIEVLLSFCADANGVPYTLENIKSLGPKDLYEGIVSVCKKCAEIRVDLISDAQKKNSVTSA